MSDETDGPIDFVQDYYGLTDDEMFRLFAADGTTQRQYLEGRPELRAAVRELGALLG